MNTNNFIKTQRDCEGHLIPSGDPIKLNKGTKVKITQSLGGDFTLYVNGNLVKISGLDGDAINQKKPSTKIASINNDFDEKIIWEVLKTCYDPEIPVNIVDLGLIYDLNCIEKKTNSYFV